MKINVSIAKLSPSTIKSSKRLMSVLGISVIVLVMIIIVNSVVTSEVEKIEDKKRELDTVRSQITTLEKQIEQKNNLLESENKLTNKIMSKDDFITFLGRSSEIADVSIVSLKSGQIMQSGAVESVNFQFELRGELGNLNSVVDSIDDLETTYNIRKISMRKEGEYKWLIRPFDKKDNQSWLQFDASGMPPQNIPLPQALPEIVLNEKGEILEIRDSRLASVDDLLKGSKYSIFLDISFLIAK